MNTDLSKILDLDVYPIDDKLFAQQCRQTLDEEGVLVLPGFVRSEAVEQIKAEGKTIQPDAYYTQSSHNVYLSPADKDYPETHCRNRLVESTKGCVTTDQIPEDADAGDMNFEQTEAILSGSHPVESLTMDPGTLVLFRGRNSMHRVTPVTGDTTRMLVGLAYNSQPGIALSESASNTFYGRYLPL